MATTTKTMATASTTMMVQITTDGDGKSPKLHCPVCNKALVSLAGYVKHVKKHEPPGGYKCKSCDALYCHEKQLQEHVEKEHTQASLSCPLCSPNVKFSSAEAYLNHNNEMHNGQEQSVTTCGGGSGGQGTKGRFKCQQCEISFPTKYNLKQHQQSAHNGNKNLGQKGRLIDQERHRNAEKPYKCEICGKCFANRQSLTTHSTLHPTARLVECKCCRTRFSSSSNLIKHRRLRPDTCGRPEFNRIQNNRSRLQSKKTNSNGKISEEMSRNQSVDSTDSDDDVPLASRLKRETISTGHSSDSEDEYPDFEPANSDDDDDGDFKLPAPALIKEEEEHEADFVYQNASLYGQSSRCDVKEESCSSAAGDIFIEKDKLLDVLLNADDDDVQTKPFESLKVEESAGGDDEMILDEIAAVPIGRADEEEFLEEDMLALKDPEDCFENDIALDSASDEEQSQKYVVKSTTTTTRRKYRRRSKQRSPSLSPPPPPTAQLTELPPKRVAKISKKELKERLKMLNKVEKTWKCPHCVKIYHIRKPYEKHLRDDHKLSEEKINEIFKDADAHAKLDEEVFKCRICSKIYLVEKRLETHMRVHGEDGALTVKCPCYCNLFFASKEEATAHAHKQHKELLYCEKCDKYMTGHDSLKNHEKNYHAKKQQQQQQQQRCQPRNLICDKCGKKFSGRTSLSDHVRSDCGRLPLYQCSVCGKRLSTAGILKTHMLLHQAETPYQCDKCGKTFKVKAQYKSHLKTRHTDFKPYKCHLCPKEYPYRESLLTHMTVHTGIKRFLCNNCGKRFTCISNLQAHRKVHADTCGQLPLNAKATQYMGVQRGKLLIGAKPEAGMEYEETKTLIAQEVIDRDVPMAQELNFPSEPSAPLATVPLNYHSAHLVPHIVLQTMQAEANESN